MAAGTLSKSVEKILQGCAERIHAHKASLNVNVVEIGRELATVRDTLPDGEHFQDWVADTCKYSRSTAYNYIAAFEMFGNFKRLEHLENDTLFALSKCREAAVEAKLLASKGQHIDADRARQLIADARAKMEPVSTAVDTPEPIQGEIVDESDDYEPPEESDDLGPSVPTHVVPTPREPAPKAAPVEPNVIGSYLFELRQWAERLADEAPHVRLAVKESGLGVLESIEA